MSVTNYEGFMRSGAINRTSVDGVCLGYPEKVEQDNTKNAIYGTCFLYIQEDKCVPFRYLCAWPGKERSFDIQDLTKACAFKNKSFLLIRSNTIGRDTL
jgi:hypothetical protein